MQFLSPFLQSGVQSLLFVSGCCQLAPSVTWGNSCKLNKSSFCTHSYYELWAERLAYLWEKLAPVSPWRTLWEAWPRRALRSQETTPFQPPGQNLLSAVVHSISFSLQWKNINISSGRFWTKHIFLGFLLPKSKGCFSCQWPFKNRPCTTPR